MTKIDYYVILQIDKSADAETIKKAYRKLAMRYHPDRNAGDLEAEKKFKEIGEAYAILSDPTKRNAYDQFGHSGINQDTTSSAYGNAYSNFSDIFGDIFNGAFGVQGDDQTKKDSSLKKNGEDINKSLTIDLEDAIRGVVVNILLDVYKKCVLCNGFGTRDGRDLNACKKCFGSGKQRVQQGFFIIQRVCTFCKGNGYVLRDMCSECENGRVYTKKTLPIKVPSGVDDGDTIRLVNEGHFGYFGGSFGNLYLCVNIRKHKIFQRDGLNLFCEVPVSFVLLTIGGIVTVPTVDGIVKLKVPESTQPLSVFKLRGKGLKSIKDSNIGDLFCKLVIEIPINLSVMQKTILNDFQNSFNVGFNNHMPLTNKWLNEVDKFLLRLKS